MWMCKAGSGNGRWRGEVREDRICLLCKKEMGDERHFSSHPVRPYKMRDLI